jgi:hypothetical protein
MSDDVRGWLNAQGVGVLDWLLGVVSGKTKASTTQIAAAQAILSRAYDKPPISQPGSIDGNSMLRGARDKLASLIAKALLPDPAPEPQFDSLVALGLRERSPQAAD